jgi:C1A family cysteine protease
MAKKKKREKRILNCIHSRHTENDWLFEHAAAARKKPAASIPPTKDLRASWWRIGNQADTGSCVGWAAADGVLRWHLVKAGKLNSNRFLSVRFQWMAAKETDMFVSHATTFLEGSGTSIKTALDIARKYGAVEEALLPFNGNLSPLDERVFYSKAADFKIGSYYGLTVGNKLANFRTWLATRGPILARLDCDRSWDRISKNGKLDRYDRPDPNGGHAVAIVGYTKDYFIVRNSWGTTWGDRGFAYASNAYTQAAFDEAYGVIL